MSARSVSGTLYEKYPTLKTTVSVVISILQIRRLIIYKIPKLKRSGIGIKI